MQSLVFAVVVVALASCVLADDDGQYKPHLYGGDDGKYRASGDGKYDGRYAASDSAFKPVYFQSYSLPYSAYKQLKQQNVNPADVYGRNSIDYASSASAVSNAYASFGQPVYSRAQYGNEGYAKIVRQDSDLDPNTNAYHYLYQTDNGIAAEESGSVASYQQQGGTRAAGYYEYVGPDGVKYRVDYTADENGFQPRGAHLPQAP